MNLFNLSIEILTILSVFAALAVITSTNPVIAIIFLITLFLIVSIYLILMGLTFIGLSYLLVYVGAITVLFLFIIMMISIEVVQTVEVGSDYSKLLPLAYAISILFLSLLVFYFTEHESILLTCPILASSDPFPPEYGTRLGLSI